MTATIEISLYPLRDDYPAHVLRFLEKVKLLPGVESATNGMSTILIGEYSGMWKNLGELMEQEMASGYSLFVMKVASGRREFLEWKMKSENADQETEQAYFQQRIANREVEVRGNLFYSMNAESSMTGSDSSLIAIEKRRLKENNKVHQRMQK